MAAIQVPPSQSTRSRPRLPQVFIAAAAVILFIQFTILPRFFSSPSVATRQLGSFQLARLDAGLQKCQDHRALPVVYAFPVSASRVNPRWNPIAGQNWTVILKNATLFDGETFIGSVDITFSKGVVTSVSPTSSSSSWSKDANVVDLAGNIVTPGLVDLHSHHLVQSWPYISSAATGDGNEVNPLTGPLTPMVRSKDGMKTDDLATSIIASGGITTSLILPGSANIMGGEAYPVKNIPKSGPDGEEVVEEILLEYGVPKASRRRYMKMACGENPKSVYQHTRMGNAWIFREQMARAKDLMEKQDAWCLDAAVAKENRNLAAILKEKGGLPEELELDSTVAMLRGQIGVNVHCYEPEDIEDMIAHSKEFGFKIQAFHHAIEAWEVPEMIKAGGDNITVATFSTFGLYKKEAYNANLWAGKILTDHGIPLVYKSDHGSQELNAKYLMFQAATGHSFHLPKDLALQSITSVPAKSMGLNHRIGYVRPGYDADLVVWDSHPLSIGATPLQVYIDGKGTLDLEIVKDSLSTVSTHTASVKPMMRPLMPASIKQDICRKFEEGKTVITGITTSYLKTTKKSSSAPGNFTIVLNDGKVACFGSTAECISHSIGGATIVLSNGHVLPGITAANTLLGMFEIVSEGETGDGIPRSNPNPLDPENLIYAKYGVHFDGKSFDRARIGGVTRAVSLPVGEGFVEGVSVGIKTSRKNSILDGGIFKDEVALHFTVGQASKETPSISTISTAIAAIRKILSRNKEKDNIYAKAANGSIPLVISAENKDDILQLIKIKQDFPTINLVISGGAESPSVAKELAAAHIPVILTAMRPAPDSFAKKDILTGPPLTRSPASVLVAAGVKFSIALTHEGGDSHIFNLALEASWAAKYAGLSNSEAVDLVSRNIEKILDLGVEEETRDWVVWEGDPLQFGASVVLSVEGGTGAVVGCWPESL